MSIIVNPFLNIFKNELSEDFNEVYIICNNSDTIIESDIYKYNIKDTVLETIKNKLLLVKTSLSIIKKSNNKNRLILVSDSFLKDINKLNYKLNEQNIVLLMPNIKYENLLIYLTQFNKNLNLEEIFKLFSINAYFNADYSKINNLLLNFEESTYWTELCSLNLTNNFKYRTDLKELIISCKYKLTNDKNILLSDINSLFDMLNCKQKFILFCNLLISRKYCHLALNNSYLLLIMKDIIYKYIMLFKYLISYSWITFYSDEIIVKHDMNKNNNFIFDINTASALPMFPFSITEPTLNPYMPILVNNTDLNPQNNLGSLQNISYDHKKNNICNLEEFKKRLNIFSTNNVNHNIFEFVKWSENKIAITGSIMAACLQRENPLVTLFDNISDYNARLARFFDEYYALSEIDLIFLAENILEYLLNIYTFYNQIVINICKIYSTYAEPSHTKLICEKQVTYFIDTKSCLELFNNSNEILQNIKTNSNSLETYRLLEPFMLKELDEFKKKKEEQFTKEQLSSYSEYFNFDNIIFNIKFVDTIIHDKITVTYKYKIISPHINHKLNLIFANNKDFFEIIQDFSLPCIKAYYDGENVYMTPSCITAHLTFINIDHKEPLENNTTDTLMETINKYRMRGFGTWLNVNEMIELQNYVRNNHYWNNLYNKNTQISGFLNLSSILFNPRLYNYDYYYDASPVDLESDIGYNKNKILKTILSKNNYMNELFVIYKNSNIFYIFDNIETINSKGKVVEIQKWVIEACWHLVGNSKEKESNIDMDLSCTEID